jgi:hypothetical protein
MKKDGWADYPFSFHDSDELGSAILTKISKRRAFNLKTCDGPTHWETKSGPGKPEVTALAIR